MAETEKWPKPKVEALRAAADKGVLTLRATGTPSSPTWDVYLALRLDWGLSINSQLRELSRQVAKLFAQEYEGPLGSDPHVRLHDLVTATVGLDPSSGGLVPYLVPHSNDGRPSPTTEHWPSWLQLPLLKLASVTLPPVSVIDREESPQVLNRQTRSFVFDQDWRPIIEDAELDATDEEITALVGYERIEALEAEFLQEDHLLRKYGDAKPSYVVAERPDSNRR